MKPRKIPTIVEITNEKRVPIKESSDLVPIESSMASIEKRSIVIPNPATPPVAKIVMGKNFLPNSAIMHPNTIPMIPRITGFLRKNLEKLVTENTGQAFELLAVITGEHALLESSLMSTRSFVS